MWVGTKGGGIDFIRGNRAVHIPPDSGIPEIPVFSVLDDGKGTLWLSTTRGILRISVQQLHDLVDRKRDKVESYLLGKSDGMRTSECGGMSQPAATRTTDGVLWFVTAKGFVHTSTFTEAQILPPLQARIAGFRIDQSDVPVSERVVLGAGQTDLEVRFDAVRLSNPMHVQFRYKLEGYDRDWTTTKGHIAHYKHLPPGIYQFAAEARDPGQPWNGFVARAAVVQSPFLYQTAWFYASMVLAIAGTVVVGFRWRGARTRGRARVIRDERNRIAREWHDTLMASLAAIAWQLEATGDRLGDKTSQATKSLELARDMVRHSQTEARRIIWDLQDDGPHQGALSEALSKVLDGVSTRTDVNAELRISGNEAPLSARTLHHLTCICQEAVTNAIRHAAPSAIEVALEYSQARVTLSVKDNGRGFRRDKNGAPGHFGLSVMEERARKLGGDVRIVSAPGCGTEIVVEVPGGMPA
jgi:signal transduction histidine kinase